MYELDREKFGSFIARLRKEKGYTQKELAEKLSISDKAVSKWETGKSLPDISLLVPLADIMEVTVTELLEARRIEGAQITAVPVEDMVKKALTYSEEIQKKNTRQKVKHCILCGAGILAGLLEILGLVLLTKDTDFLSRGSVKNFVALVKNGSFLVRITDMTILIEKEFIYGSSKRPNPTDYYRKQHYQCG